MKIASRPQSIFWLGTTLWNLYGDVRDLLFDQQGLRLSEWTLSGRATLVKSGSGRAIYHVRLPGLDLYVKHFRSMTPVGRLHQLVRRGRAEKEFHLAHLLQERGVDTITPIALGERRERGALIESYLLTEAIPGGLTLFELIERCVLQGRLAFPPTLRFRFALELARLAATIHDAGIEHRDLHERNIIVQPVGDDYRFYLLDLHELKVHRRLRWSRARRELSRMGRYFTLRTSAADRWRFFQHYGKLRGIPRAKIRQLARDVETQTLESRADFWRRRDMRPAQKNPRIDLHKGAGARAWGLKELAGETVRSMMADPDAPFQDAVVKWWKIGRATRVSEVELPTIRRGDNLIYKQYYFKGWLESFAALFRDNQATRAWNNGAALLLRELPTPRPLLLIQKMRWGLPITSYLLTERISDPQTITRYLDRHLSQSVGAERKRILRGVLREAALLLRKLHDRRVTHRDLKASNVLASPTEDKAQPKLWLIDLDGVQTWQRVPERCRLQNLTRFNVSFHQNPWITRSDRLRFLKLYLARDFRDRARWKELWRQIYFRTQAKIERNTRHGRSVV